MKSSKNYLIGILFIATCALALLAWRQYQQIAQLQATVLGDDSVNLRKRLAELEKRNRALADELSLRNAGGTDAQEADNAGGPGNQRQRRFGAFQAIRDNPEFQKLQAIQAKARLDDRYAALFKSLNLPPGQLDQLKNLLVQRQQAAQDAAMAAIQQGINPRTDPQDFRQAENDAEAAVDQQIQAQLGDSAYAQYQQYQQTLPERSTVTQVQTALSYSAAPLTDSQASQLIQILQQTAPQGGGGGLGGFFGGGNPGVAITPQALTLAQGILTAPQLQALQQVQQQQQAQQQMQQLIRAARQANSGGGGGGGGGG